MDQHPHDEQPRGGLKHEPSLLLTQRRIREQLAALTAQAPGHAISVEGGIPGRAPRFVAKATTGDARPYLVITTDLDELRRELTGPPAPPPLPRRVPGTSWTPSATG
jgi:hypothetical protein